MRLNLKVKLISTLNYYFSAQNWILYKALESTLLTIMNIFINLSRVFYYDKTSIGSQFFFWKTSYLINPIICTE